MVKDSLKLAQKLSPMQNEQYLYSSEHKLERVRYLCLLLRPILGNFTPETLKQLKHYNLKFEIGSRVQLVQGFNLFKRSML